MLNVYRSGGIALKTNQHSFAVGCVATHTDFLGRAPSELLLTLVCSLFALRISHSECFM